MLSTRPATRRTIQSLLQASYICPRCQSQRRTQSSSSLPPQPPQNEQQEHILEDIQQSPGHGSETQHAIRQQILLEQMLGQQRVQNQGPLYRQKQLHGIAPMYPEAQSEEKPKATGEAGESYDRPFSPTIAAFVTGLGLGFGAAAFLYFFSGASRVVSHNRQERKQLARRRVELFGLIPSKSDLRAHTLDERREWFEQTAKVYAAFTPNSHTYLDTTLPDIQRAIEGNGAEGAAKVDTIIGDCAAALHKLRLGGELDYMLGKEAWKTIHQHLEQIVEVAEDGRDVSPEIRQKVKQRLDGLRKLGTRVGRSERRALEEEEKARMALMK